MKTKKKKSLSFFNPHYFTTYNLVNYFSKCLYSSSLKNSKTKKESLSIKK